MSIAINIKVNDGVVLAADSATTVIQSSGHRRQPSSVANIYNNANKVFNLRKNYPVGMISWGAGGIGSASIATLAKDLRKRFTEGGGDWELCDGEYDVHWVAEKVREFMFVENYEAVFRHTEPQNCPQLGFVVAGYSAGGALAEEYIISVSEGQCPQPQRIREANEVGITWNGQGEAIMRLIRGFGSLLPTVLQEEFDATQDEIDDKMDGIARKLQAVPVHPAMPIQDVINLAEFLVDTTIQFHKYLPGAPTVGGPIEIAAITRHEGFKWVQRKHYYSSELNLGGPTHEDPH